MASMAMSVIIGMACHLMGSAEQWRAVGLGPKVSDISNGTHVHASYSFENLHRRKPLTIAMSLFGHSMGFAATLGGDVLAVLELERYHKIRYFDLRVLTGMNENFRNIGHLCEWVMDHRQQSCIERLTSMEPEPDEDDASFEIRAMKQREKVLYENAMERYMKPALHQLCQLAHLKLRVLGDRRAQDADPAGSCEIQYDIAVSPAHCLSSSQYGAMLVQLIKPYVQASEWLLVDHHHAHAAMGWLDSPFYRQKGYSSLIPSYDGGGGDGNLRLFLGKSGDHNLKALGPGQAWHSYGNVYEMASSLVRDLAWGTPYGSKPPCPYGKKTSCQMALAGSFMAFAAIGNVREEWRPGAQLYLSRGLWNEKLWPSPFGGECTLHCFLNESSVDGGDPDWWYRYVTSGQHVGGCLDHAYTRRGASYSGWTRYYFACDNSDSVEQSQQMDRDFAATIQDEFDQEILTLVRTKLDVAEVVPNSLVITGGSAMNVKTNTALARGLNLPTHVPPAPGDAGIPLGAAWLMHPPPADQRVGLQGAGVQFTGAPLTDNKGQLLTPSDLEDLAQRYAATRIQSMGSFELLAGLLIRSESIVAVARGGAEFGPRALGHRSFLAAAHRGELKERLNRLKHRKWYRPCAPIVAREDLELLFEPGPDLAYGIPYMSFAPPLQKWVKKWLPGITHLDGTARPQTVDREDDPWMHSLLHAVRQEMAQKFQDSGTEIPHKVGVLINTSLNPKGMPIASDPMDILQLFCAPEGRELDFVLLEETWLFERRTAMLAGLCDHINIGPAGSDAPGSFPDGLPVI